MLRLLDLLCGLVQLVEVLADGSISLHAADDMMALGLVLGGAVVAVRGRLRQVRLRGRLSRHGGWPAGPRMTFVGRSHAGLSLAVRLQCTAPVW